MVLAKRLRDETVRCNAVTVLASQHEVHSRSARALRESKGSGKLNAVTFIREANPPGKKSDSQVGRRNVVTRNNGLLEGDDLVKTPIGVEGRLGVTKCDD